MVKIKIDDREVEVAEGTTVLQAALANKIDIPYFCYHPKLSIAGNCRMCLVQIKGQNKPVISCRERVREGLEVDTTSPEVKQMQQGVLEFILLNHPLDCPICDQSGECDLQDHYFKFSKFPSRLEDQKIHKPKAKPLGPLVTLDDERCIVCTRCVRFCDEVAKTHELCVIDRGGHSELTTYPGNPLTNPYSLCTVDVCPVGALTSTDFRFQKRVWFLKTAKSICTGCATGCNIKMDWDDAQVYRTRPRDNEAVNQCWMCDEGRLSYKFINDPNRALDPMVKKNGTFQKATWEEALEAVANACDGMSSTSIIGGLSARGSCEENFALYHFAKELGSGGFFITRHEVAKPSKDDFLIDADKNPNTWFVNSLLRETSPTPTGGSLNINGLKGKRPLFLILGSLTETQKKALVSQKGALVVWLTSNLDDSFQWADVILPKPTFAEQDGTFVNRQKRVQRFWKAFEPKGQGKPVWWALGEVARRLEKPWGLKNAEDVFLKLAQEVKGFNGLTYKEIGDQGCLLPSAR